MLALTDSILLRVLLALGCGVAACLVVVAFGQAMWAIKRRIYRKRGLTLPGDDEVRDAMRGLKGCGCTIGFLACVLMLLVLLAGRLFGPGLLRTPLWWILTVVLCALSCVLGQRGLRPQAFTLLWLLWLAGLVCSFVVLGWRVGLGHLAASVLVGTFVRAAVDSLGARPGVRDVSAPGVGDEPEPPFPSDAEIDAILAHHDEVNLEKRIGEIARGEAPDSQQLED